MLFGITGERTVKPWELGRMFLVLGLKHLRKLDKNEIGTGK